MLRRELVVILLDLWVFCIIILQVFCKFNLDNYKKALFIFWQTENFVSTFLGGIDEPRQFIHYLMSFMTLDIFILRNDRWIFELCHYFILFLSTSGQSKNRQYEFRVSNTLFLESVLHSTFFFCVLILRVFKTFTFLVLSIIAIFCESIRFLLELSHCWHI